MYPVNILWEGYNTLCWYYHYEYTDELDSPGAGAGNQINFLFLLYLYEWLWEYINMDLWQLGLLPVSHKLILITHILIKERKNVCSQPDYLERYFAKVGCGISATG